MSEQHKPAFKKKKSTLETSPKLLKALKKIENGVGGTVSYVTLTERIKFTKENPDGEVYYTKSFLHSSINTEVFFKMHEGKRMKRTYAEVIQVFHDTSIDQGANYFIIG